MNPRDDRGSMLIVTLVLIPIVGLLISGLLAYIQVGLRATPVVEDARDELYAVDGTMELALDRLASGRCDAREQKVPPINGVVGLAYTCAPQARNAPPWAVLALGTHPREGLHRIDGRGEARIDGAVFSHSTVNNTLAETMTVTRQVTAVGECSKSRVRADPLVCANTDPARDPALPPDPDPNYVPPLAALRAGLATGPGTVPACPGPDQWLVQIEPGYYDDAQALTRLTDGTCPGKVVHLKPGAYYFNFNFSEAEGPCETGSRRCTWTIDDPTVTVVGGTPRGWSPGANSPEGLQIPGSCRRDEDRRPNGGVRLVFGGQSQVDIARGAVELCPQPTLPTRRVQQIAVHGLKYGATTPAKTAPAPASFTDNVGFDPPDDARVVDAAPATARLDDATSTASIELHEFDPTDIPVGSRIDAVRLRVVHAEQVKPGEATLEEPKPQTGTLTLRVTVTRSAGDPAPLVREAVGEECVPDQELCLRDEFGEGDVIDLGDMALRDPATLAALRVRFEGEFETTEAGTSGDPAAAPATATVKLDGVALEVVYTPPDLEALRGCVDDAPYSSGQSGSACALLRAGPAAVLSVHGTVYAPTAAIDIGASAVTSPVFSRGVIARHVRLATTAAAGYGGPVIGVPPPPDLPPPVPPGAVLTPGTTEDEHGLHRASGPGEALVAGAVFSHSTVRAEAGAALRVPGGRGGVAAVGACEGPITASPLNCAPQRDHAMPPEHDPAYPPPVADLRAHLAAGAATVPACPGAGQWLVQLEPGYYDDARALTRLTDGTCSAKVVHLKPGVYYFNFNFAEADGVDCETERDRCTWTIGDPTVTVVGGTPDPDVWDPDAPTPPPLPVPGSCLTGAKQPHEGVELVFGGLSRLNLAAGRLELCPPPSLDAQHIALHGLAYGNTGETTTLAAGRVLNVGGFDTPENALVFDEQYATAVLEPESSAAFIRLGGFDAAGIPPGSRIDSVRLHVAHFEEGDVATGTLKVSADRGAGNPDPPPEWVAGGDGCGPGDEFCLSGTRREDVIDIDVPGLALHDATALQQLRITVTGSFAGDGTQARVHLDGLALEVGYTPPDVEPLRGCLTQPGYDPARATDPLEACALLRAAPASTLAVHGTVYAPGAAIDVNNDIIDAPIFARGLIARHLRLATSGVEDVPALAVPVAEDDPTALLTALRERVAMLRVRTEFGAESDDDEPQLTILSWSRPR